MTTIQATQARELQAAPIGTVVTTDADETYVRADRSEYPWLLVEDTATPDSQTWLGHDDVAAYDLEITYPANYVAPQAEPEGPVWRSPAEAHVQVEVWATDRRGFRSQVSGVPCKHNHRTIEAGMTCGYRVADRVLTKAGR